MGGCLAPFETCLYTHTHTHYVKYLQTRESCFTWNTPPKTPVTRSSITHTYGVYLIYSHDAEAGASVRQTLTLGREKFTGSCNGESLWQLLHFHLFLCLSPLSHSPYMIHSHVDQVSLTVAAATHCSCASLTLAMPFATSPTRIPFH